MRERVLLLARELDHGGTERQLAEVVKFLDRDKFDIRVGCFRPAGFCGDQLRDAGIPIVPFPVQSYRSFATPKQAWRLVRYVREQGIQVVHAFDFHMNLFAVPLVKGLTSARAVSSQRNHRELTPRGLLRPLRVSDRLADCIVVNCEFLRRHMIEDEGAPASRVAVCHNGVDLRVFSPGQAVRHPALDGASLVTGVVSMLRPEKDLPALLRAFALVRGLQAGMKLVLVGSGVMLSELQSLAASLGIEGDVIFEPASPKAADWMRALDIFVLPSKSEAFSNALMEAMACRCSVVASKVGGNPELVRHRETGLLFEPGDDRGLAEQLKALIGDPELRRRLASSGQRFVSENFAIQNQAQRMGEIYLDLLGRRRQPALVRPQEPEPANSR